jgi:hypothetical protein
VVNGGADKGSKRPDPPSQSAHPRGGAHPDDGPAILDRPPGHAYGWVGHRPHGHAYGHEPWSGQHGPAGNLGHSDHGKHGDHRDHRDHGKHGQAHRTR